MEDVCLDPSDDDDDDKAAGGGQWSIDPTDDLTRVIRVLCGKRDALHQEIDPDEVLQEIRTDHPTALLRRGTALALKACRRLITSHLRRLAALDPEKEGPQFALPGLEHIPSHTMYPVPVPGTKLTKIVARHTRDATLEQHRMCLLLKQVNTQRCVAREAQQVRIIDLLDQSGCNTLREWERRFGQDAA